MPFPKVQFSQCSPIVDHHFHLKDLKLLNSSLPSFSSQIPYSQMISRSHPSEPWDSVLYLPLLLTCLPLYTHYLSSLNIVYRLTTLKFISLPQTFPPYSDSISNCQHDISIWLSNNHLELNMSKTKLLVFFKPVHTVFCTQVNGKTIFYLLMPKKVESFLTPLSHIQYPIHQQIFT